MLDDTLIMGMTVGLTDIMKKKFKVDDSCVWLLVIFNSACLSALNALAVHGDIMVALKEAIYRAAISSGVYSWGVKMLKKSQPSV
jgi:hypothetical protein